ncbi:MAG: bactofilin family protein [Anaerovoracaceae bacterium]
MGFFSKNEPVKTSQFSGQEQEEDNSCNVITKSTTIHGNISSKDHIDIMGGVKGDVTSTKDISLGGVIEGNIKGRDISVDDGRVRGNFNVSTVELSKHALVVGNFAVDENISCNGKIKGNIISDNEVVLGSEAAILGNLKGHSISIDSGAMVKGKVEISRDDILDESLFNIEESFLKVDEN